MIRSVEIKGFRGIKEGQLDDLSPLTVLVGPNGSGKSTVLDALYVGTSVPVGNAVGEVVRRHKGLGQGARWLLWRAGASNTATTDIRNDKNSLRRSLLDFASEHSNHTNVLTLRVHQGGANNVAHGRIIFRSSEDYTVDIEQVVGHYSLVPSVRLVTAYAEEHAPLHELFTQAAEQGRLKQAVTIMKAVVTGLDDIKILAEGDKPIVCFGFEDHALPTALGGDGIRALLRIALEMAARPKGLVLLEEPEVHQHPGAIWQTAKVILEAVRREIQVVLSTHSLELIDALLAEASGEDLEKLSVYRVQLDDGVLKSARTNGRDAAFARTEIEDDLR